MKFCVNLRMEKLKIGFDAKRAVRNFTGLGNYSRLVIDVLSREYPANDYRLYTPSVRQNDRLKTLIGRKNVTLVTPDTATGRALPALWRVYGGLTSQIARDGIGLFHGLSNELPLDIARAGIPTVVTVHDLIFRRLPECYKPVDRAIYDYKFRHACENATRVIAISERTRDDIVELYGIKPGKIDIVYQGCDPRPCPCQVQSARALYYRRRDGRASKKPVAGSPRIAASPGRRIAHHRRGAQQGLCERRGARSRRTRPRRPCQTAERGTFCRPSGTVRDGDSRKLYFPL